MSVSAPTSPSTPTHPFANTRSLIQIVREEPSESSIDDEVFEDDDTVETRSIPPQRRSMDARSIRSIISHEIWLGDHSGNSFAFARNVTINGWTCVGDQLAGAYIVYEIVVTTKEGNTFHVFKRYSDFEKLRKSLLYSLPRDQRVHIQSLPPKSPLARYRPVFLDKRRRLLQEWLCRVLLHPDIGGCKACRQWIMD